MTSPTSEIELQLWSSFDPLTRKAKLTAEWGVGLNPSGSEEWEIDASGAIVAEERGFLLALGVIPIHSIVTVFTRSTHIPRRFRGEWQANTAETDDIISQAVQLARIRHLTIKFV